MFPPRRILFPTDFSACAEGAYRHAAYLADRFEAEVHVLHAVESERAPVRDWPEAPGFLQISMADICADLRLPAPPSPDDTVGNRVPVVEEEIVGSAPEVILDYIRDEDIDLVVMGTHGRSGWRRGVLGSVAEAVTRRAPCPVLTVRPMAIAGDGPWAPARVLLALDVAPDDVAMDAGNALPAAARWAARIAVAYQAPLDLLHVTSLHPSTVGGAGEALLARRAARPVLKALAARLRSDAGGALSVTARVDSGDPAAIVRDAAEAARTHLLVVGTHGRRGVRRALLGSVAEALVRTAPCPVLVVRDDGAEEAPEAAEAERAASAV